MATAFQRWRLVASPSVAANFQDALEATCAADAALHAAIQSGWAGKVERTLVEWEAHASPSALEAAETFLDRPAVERYKELGASLVSRLKNRVTKTKVESRPRGKALATTRAARGAAAGA